MSQVQVTKDSRRQPAGGSPVRLKSTAASGQARTWGPDDCRHPPSQIGRAVGVARRRGTRGRRARPGPLLRPGRVPRPSPGHWSSWSTPPGARSWPPAPPTATATSPSSPSATARLSTDGTTSTRSPSSTHSAGRPAELVKHRPVRSSRDFYPERDGGDCTWPAACLQPVCRMCGFLAGTGHAQPAHRSAHANRRPARLRPVGSARLRQRRTGCPEHCRRPASTTCVRRIVDLVHEPLAPSHLKWSASPALASRPDPRAGFRRCPSRPPAGQGSPRRRIPR